MDKELYEICTKLKDKLSSMLDSKGINYQVEERHSGYIVYSNSFSCAIHMYTIDISIETVEVTSYHIKNDIDGAPVFITRLTINEAFNLVKYLDHMKKEDFITEDEAYRISSD